MKTNIHRLLDQSLFTTLWDETHTNVMTCNLQPVMYIPSSATSVPRWPLCTSCSDPASFSASRAVSIFDNSLEVETLTRYFSSLVGENFDSFFKNIEAIANQNEVSERMSETKERNPS
jgi:hypothetical protein